MRSGPGVNYSAVTSIPNGASVQVLEIKYDASSQSNWYKIQYNGYTGWGNAGYIRFASSVNVTHDLNYLDSYAFGSELLLWHKAGGNCYPGLFYRRLAEAKVFSFGNYEESKTNNANYKRNTYGYDYPDCEK